MRTRGNAFASVTKPPSPEPPAAPMAAAAPTHSKPADPSQEAIAQITKATKSMDWKRAQSLAEAAVKSGHLSDEQVDQAIDGALPDPEKAARLPLHRLFAVVSTASPQRRQDYAAAIQQYPGLDQLPPDAQSQIADHLRLIGLGANNA